MKHYITTEFAKLLGEKRLKALNDNPSSVYGLDSKFNICYLNPGWFQYSEENGGAAFVSDDWLLGRNVFDSIPNEMQPFYRSLFESTLKEKKPPLIARQQEYECSSLGLYRRLSMHLYPIGKDSILIVSSVVVEEAYTSPPREGLLRLDEGDYIDGSGFLHQCANCRRIKNRNEPERWDWVPKFIAKPHPKTSHGVCVPCIKQYYSEPLQNRGFDAR